MSRKREDRSITKHTLNLYTGDYARLQALYTNRIGAAKIIRDIIRAHILKVESDAAQRLPTEKYWEKLKSDLDQIRDNLDQVRDLTEEPAKA